MISSQLFVNEKKIGFLMVGLKEIWYQKIVSILFETNISLNSHMLNSLNYICLLV